MADLYWGFVVMTGVALVVFRFSAWYVEPLPNFYRPLLAAAIVLAMFAYVRLVWQSNVLAAWLPFSNLIVIGNWFPLFLAALAGILSRSVQIHTLRRGFGVLVLAGFSVYAMLAPFWGETPVCGELRNARGDSVQTTDFTCSAASAATLLRMHGIEATEQEMAQLCLTRRGTNWLGLYRGLKLKTANTPWDVEVVRCSVDELSTQMQGPMIVEVGLDSNERVDPAFRYEFGWVPGMKHSVILREFTTHGRAAIVDPSPQIGREEWDFETLQSLWRGYGMRLIPRS